MELAINNVWIIMSAALVFLMHAGFACVEAGFTQSKNTANIIMKNFMTIAIGSITYYIIGYSLMYGSDVLGIIGLPQLFYIPAFAEGDVLDPYVFWFFQAVFAATCATIVSGAVAERTKFGVYLVFCLVMCSVIYPITGHWIWGGGWLSELGFHDFAGSTAVHAIGGFSALIGAKMVGARAGKYPNRGKVKTIPPHSIPLGALGVLLLWFGWFGFNCGSTLSGTDGALGLVATNTILAGASGAMAAMFFSSAKNGKPDVGLTLNGCLAGLVGITAGCYAVSPLSALIIGIIASILMVLSVEFFDLRAKIDDPVGAISVHGVCGAVGTILVGVFAQGDLPAGISGLIDGDGFAQLGIQTLGVLACGLFAATISLIYFAIAKKVVGLRVERHEEISGLDTAEHGISAYANMGIFEEL